MKSKLISFLIHVYGVMVNDSSVHIIPKIKNTCLIFHWNNKKKSYIPALCRPEVHNLHPAIFGSSEPGLADDTPKTHAQYLALY